MAALNSDGVGSTNVTSIGDFDEATQIGNLTNKVALITGGSSGLGRAIAQAYAAAGAYVVTGDLTPSPPDAPTLAAMFKTMDHTTPTVDLINSRYPPVEGRPRAMYVNCDVTDASSIQAAIASTVKHYGRLDIMVNNAGVSVEAKGIPRRLHEQDEKVFDIDMAINARGVWLCCKYALAQMLTQPLHPSGDRGWIINMSSIASVVGLPSATAYCASKGAVLQLTRTAALEYAADRIHINCINPGYAETNFIESIRTDMRESYEMAKTLHPWGRLALPLDVAKMAVFLAGPGATFCTGGMFTVDGGYTAQ